MARLYRVKGTEGLETYIEVLRECDDGYDVLITTIREFTTKRTEEHVSNDLLDSCIRTGYIVEAPVTALAG